jgi:hypothetical protein
MHVQAEKRRWEETKHRKGGVPTSEIWWGGEETAEEILFRETCQGSMGIGDRGKVRSRLLGEVSQPMPEVVKEGKRLDGGTGFAGD